jgi:hypothetical protein
METPLQIKIRQQTSLLRLIGESIYSGSSEHLPPGTIEDSIDVAIGMGEDIYESMDKLDRPNTETPTPRPLSRNWPNGQ